MMLIPEFFFFGVTQMFFQKFTTLLLFSCCGFMPLVACADVAEELTETPLVIPAETHEEGYRRRLFRMSAANGIKLKSVFSVEDYQQELTEVLELLGISGELTQLESSGSGSRNIVIAADNPTTDRVVFYAPQKGNLYCLQYKGKWMLYPRGYAKNKDYKLTLYWQDDQFYVLEEHPNSLATGKTSWPKSLTEKPELLDTKVSTKKIPNDE